MMEAADPAYLFDNYDLPMDAASRMARAEEMGFAENWLHGSHEGGISAFDGDTVWLSRHTPSGANHASSFAPLTTGKSEGNTVFPVRVRGGETPTDLRSEAAEVAGGTPGDYSMQEAQQLALGDTPPQAPVSGVEVFPDFEDFPGGHPHKIDAGIAHPKNIRSRFARFDPRLSHLAHLSAGVGGLGILVPELRAYLEDHE